MDFKKLRHSYAIQKKDARVRGVEWDLSYAMWELKWVLSGKLHLRGRKGGQYVMSRYNDTGPYSWNNTFIQLHSDNVKEAQKGNKARLGIKQATGPRTKFSTCPHCDKVGDNSNMARWHFDNCKQAQLL